MDYRIDCSVEKEERSTRKRQSRSRRHCCRSRFRQRRQKEGHPAMMTGLVVMAAICRNATPAHAFQASGHSLRKLVVVSRHRFSRANIQTSSSSFMLSSLSMRSGVFDDNYDGNNAKGTSSDSGGSNSNSNILHDALSQPGLILPSHPDHPVRSIAAPMVAASDYPFRHFLRKHKYVDLAYTQMLHSRNFCGDPTFRTNHLDFWEAGIQYPNLRPSQLRALGVTSSCDGENKEYDHNVSNWSDKAPLIVQIAGHDIKRLVDSVLQMQEHAQGGISGFDLNCGCPQGIARKGKYGAFLMEEDSEHVCRILSALSASMNEHFPNTAISCKIRLPQDDNTLLERIPRLVETGINHLAIHGRTLHENKTKVSACHVDRMALAISKAREVVPNFQVIANGGMEFHEDIRSVLETTQANAAMSSEALLETPNIFLPSSQRPLSPRQRLNQQLGFARDYLAVCRDVCPPVPGVLGKDGSMAIARGHLFKFLHRYMNDNPDLRIKLANSNGVKSIDDAFDLVDELDARYDGATDDEMQAMVSAELESSWYRRHRSASRKVHQKHVNVESDVMVSATSEIASSLELSVEERKRQMKDRIAKMKAARQKRNLVVSEATSSSSS